MIINVTKHPLTLAHPDRPDELIVVEPSGVVINARAIEEVVETRHNPDGAVTLVRTRFVPDEESERELAKLEQEHPGAIVVGSLIAAQTFPGRVVGMIPLPGFERVPPAEKRMRSDKFSVF